MNHLLSNLKNIPIKDYRKILENKIMKYFGKYKEELKINLFKILKSLKDVKN